MPANQTITASDFFNFVAKTRAKASEVNTNFTMFRGHILPFDPNTIATASDTYDLGASDAQWNNGYFNNFPKVNGQGLNNVMWQPGAYGLGVFQDTTTTWTIKKEDGTNLSTTNYGIVRAYQHPAAVNTGSSQYVEITITANVDITSSGSNWHIGGAANMSVTVLDLVYLYDYSVGSFGLSYYVGSARPIIPASRCSTGATTSAEAIRTASAVNTLCSVTPCFWMYCTYVASGSHWRLRADGYNNVHHGSSDGIVRHYQPTITGYSANPPLLVRWTMHGETVWFNYHHTGTAYGTSNTAGLKGSVPIPPQSNYMLATTRVIDSSAIQTLTGFCWMTTGGHAYDVYKDMQGTGWTAINGKGYEVNACYRSYDDYSG